MIGSTGQNVTKSSRSAHNGQNTRNAAMELSLAMKHVDSVLVGGSRICRDIPCSVPRLSATRVLFLFLLHSLSPSHTPLTYSLSSPPPLSQHTHIVLSSSVNTPFHTPHCLPLLLSGRQSRLLPFRLSSTPTRVHPQREGTPQIRPHIQRDDKGSAGRHCIPDWCVAQSLADLPSTSPYGLSKHTCVTACMVPKLVKHVCSNIVTGAYTLANEVQHTNTTLRYSLPRGPETQCVWSKVQPSGTDAPRLHLISSYPCTTIDTM